MKRKYVRDDCKHLNMVQVVQLIKHGGLGATCEYDLEALQRRKIELGERSAAKLGNAWDIENDRGNAAPDANNTED